MKNIRTSAEKDTAEKEVIRGFPSLEMLHKMRDVANYHHCRCHYAQLMTSCELVEAYRTPKHAEHVVTEDVNVGKSLGA